eukprot:364323-Chlamydomonas_euryale.AAC.3
MYEPAIEWRSGRRVRFASLAAIARARYRCFIHEKKLQAGTERQRWWGPGVGVSHHVGVARHLCHRNGSWGARVLRREAIRSRTRARELLMWQPGRPPNEAGDNGGCGGGSGPSRTGPAEAGSTDVAGSSHAADQACSRQMGATSAQHMGRKHAMRKPHGYASRAFPSGCV